MVTPVPAFLLRRRRGHRIGVEVGAAAGLSAPVAAERESLGEPEREWSRLPWGGIQ